MKNPAPSASLQFSGSIFHCLLFAFVPALAIGQDESSVRPPNILFAIADDLSFPHMGAYGTEWVRTPGFDQVAREGLLFNRCYTPNAKCAPSRSCILTGRNSWQLEAAANHWCFFPAKFSSYVEVLGEHGYATGMTGKGWAPGIAKDADGKSRQMTGKPFNRRKAKPPTRAISGNDYAGNFKDFLDTVPDDAPFCFWYGSTEPHRRYEFQSGVNKGNKKLSDIDQVPAFWPDNDVVRHDMLDYALEVEHFDSHLQRMLRELEKRGKLDNTLVVVTADNGMPFPRIKGQEYEMSNHLPLAIMWREGIKSPGRTIDALVSFIDLAPTYLELAGIPWQQSKMAPSPGKSLTHLFRKESDDSHRDFLLIGKERHDVGRPNDEGYPIRGIVQGSFLLIRNFKTERWPAGNPETGYLNTDGSPTKTELINARRSGTDDKHWQLAFGFRPEYEMFNIETDRECLTNLADADRYANLREKMKTTMQDALQAEDDPRLVGNGDVFDEYPYANGRERNFHQRYLEDPGSMRAGWVNQTDFEPVPHKNEASAPKKR